MHLQGVVTFAFADDDTCFVQDQTGGIRVQLPKGSIIAEAGQSIEIWANVGSAGEAPSLIDPRFTLRGPARLPRAVPVTPAELQSRSLLYRRVSVTGVLQSAAIGYNSVATLRVNAGGIDLPVRAPAPAVSDAASLIDAEVRVPGVLVSLPGAESSAALHGIWMANYADVEVLSAARPAAQYPVTTIEKLRSIGPGHLPAHRVRIRGFVSRYSDVQMPVVRDATGAIIVSPVLAQSHLSGPVDLAGFLGIERGELVLKNATDTSAPSRGPAGPPLITALAIHQLPLEEARMGSPVRLRGIVTLSDPRNGLLFMQDSSDGIYITPEYHTPAPLRVGDLVQVEGETGEGDFAPVVSRARITILGRAPLPAPDTADPESIFLGRRDSRWLELHGVVQDVAADSHEALLTIRYGSHRFRAHILAPQTELSGLMNSSVRLRGVCAAQVNNRRQLLGIVLHVPGANYIQVEQAGLPDPFGAPLRSSASILQFASSPDLEHRIRLRGVVTCSERSGPTWIQDATGSVLVQDHDQQTLAPGDLVDVVGFPGTGPFSPVLSGALIRKFGVRPAPRATAISGEEALSGGYDAALVRVEGTLRELLPRTDKLLLLLQSGAVGFSAEMPAASRPHGIRTGDRLQITGICSVFVDDSRAVTSPRSFQILVRSMDDIKILTPAPWLTLPRLLPVFGITLMAATVTLFWANWLRRKVRAQTEKLLARSAELQVALYRANEAESIEQAQRDVLELVARDEKLDRILQRLAQLVEERLPGVSYSLQLEPPGQPRVSASPTLPAEWRDTLAGIDIGHFCEDGAHALPALSQEPAWALALHSAPAAKFGCLYLDRIRQESAVIGVTIAFMRGDLRLHATGRGFLLAASNLAALAAERRTLYNQLAFRAQYDILTGLENRASLFDKLSHELRLASHDGSLLALLYIDLDGFKSINDSFGHNAGDTVLREVAARMLDIVRRSDTVARLGGDEFAVLLPRIAGPEDATRIGAHLQESISRPVCCLGQQLVVGASIGIGIFPDDGSDSESLLRAADGAMYREKPRGGREMARLAGSQSETKA